MKFWSLHCNVDIDMAYFLNELICVEPKIDLMPTFFHIRHISHNFSCGLWLHHLLHFNKNILWNNIANEGWGNVWIPKKQKWQCKSIKTIIQLAAAAPCNVTRRTRARESLLFWYRASLSNDFLLHPPNRIFSYNTNASIAYIKPIFVSVIVQVQLMSVIFPTFSLQ